MKRWSCPVLFSLVWLLAPTASASSVLPINLVDIADESALIFHGRCIAATHTTVPDKTGRIDIPATSYTFELIDGLKGTASETKTVVIKQLGRFQDGRQFFATPEMLSLPEYELGETYLLFINKNGVTGLTSPVGMPQGVFKIDEGKAVNMAGNLHILYGMQSALETAGHASVWREAAAGARPGKKAGPQGVSVDALKALVRDLLSGRLTAPSRKKELHQ